MQINRDKMLKNLTQTITNFTDRLEKMPICDLDSFNSKDTLVVMIDMVNGFCKYGALSSPNVEKLIPKMSMFLDQCIKKDIPILAYQDSHSSNRAAEFDFYPPHCISGSDESAIVDELQREELHIKPKNSTNGFLAFNPLDEFKNARNFLVIGCVTDYALEILAPQ